MLDWITRSVRAKLLMVVVISTLTALAVAATALMVYDLHNYEQSRVDDLGTLADVLGTASAPPLAFNDPRAGTEILSLLRVRPSIIAGALYDTKGSLFAAYAPEQLREIGIVGAAGDTYLIQGGRIVLSKPVFEKGERVGTLYLVAKYEAAKRLLDFGLIVGAVVLLSLLAAVGLSTWLRRTLTGPIMEVTQAAERVMEHRDFSARARKTTTDEIGYLVDTFNAMLDEVGARQQELSRADRKKDEFLAMLSHELRNPLNPIRNALVVLRMAGGDAARVQWAAEIIDRQSLQLVRLLDDLTDATRIVQNKVELRMEIVSVASVVEMAVETIRPTFENNRQKLEVGFPKAPLHVRADSARLAQVFGNLLNNAAKYTDPGGRIALTVAEENGVIGVSVRDSGVGIAPEDLSSVFEMFTQLPGAAHRAGGGLGIGLALVRALVEMQGGRVEARSAGVGKGSEFVVTLPAASASAVAVESAPVEPAQVRPEAGLSILVADDVPDSVESLAMGLRMLGHRVLVAADGTQALDAAIKFPPDIAILDVGMPGMTGYEVAAKLREFPWGRRIFLVALTGWGQREDVRRAHEAGFDKHMTKPADFPVLERLIEEVRVTRAAGKPERSAAK